MAGQSLLHAAGCPRAHQPTSFLTLIEEQLKIDQLTISIGLGNFLNQDGNNPCSPDDARKINYEIGELVSEYINLRNTTTQVIHCTHHCAFGKINP
jgi:hypothetical protein